MVSISNLSGVWLAELLTSSHPSAPIQVVSIKVNGNFPHDESLHRKASHKFIYNFSP